MYATDIDDQKKSDVAHNEAEEKSTADKKDFKDPLIECQKELANWKDSYLRVGADFENFKKRVEREKVQWIKMTQSNLLQDLLLIVDDFDRAFESADKNVDLAECKLLIDGFEMTRKALQKMLQKYEVKEIVEHDIFNPQLHEAIMHADSSEHISGAIVAVLSKGYLFKGELLRPAKVSVAK